VSGACDPVWLAGVDGCRAGWLVALMPTGRPMELRFELCTTFSDVLALAETPAVVAVDIPIGLPERAMRGGHACDIEARARLGERRSSVFAVPSRAAVQEALAHSDPPLKVSKQCFHLFPKIRDVDVAITPDLQSRVREVHPELAFWALNGKRPLDLPKKVKRHPDAPGLALRADLLERAGFPRDILNVHPWRRSDVGPDDVLDACALVWSAERLYRGAAVTLPANPPRDGRGLLMEISA